MDPEVPKRRAGSRRTVLRLVGYVGAAAGLFLLVAVAAVGWLTATDSGLRMLFDRLSDPISQAAGVTIDVDGPAGSLWSRFEAATVTVEGPDGLRVYGEGLRFDWAPLRLIDRELSVREMAARRLDIALPEAPAVTEEAAPGEPFVLPRLPFRVSVGRIDLPAISISPDAESRYEASLIGSASASELGRLDVDLSLETRSADRPADRLSVEASLGSGSNPDLSVTAEAELPSHGLAWRLLDLGDELSRDTTLVVEGEGPLQGWAGFVALNADGLAELDGRVEFAFDEASRTVTADMRLTLLSAAVLGLPDMFEGDYLVTAIAALDDPDHIQIDALSLQNARFGTVRGWAGLGLDDETLSGELSLELAPGAMQSIDPGLAIGSGFVDVRLSGRLAAPAVSADAALAGLSGYGVAADWLGLAVELALPGDGTVRFGSALTATGASWPDPAIDLVLGPSVSASLVAVATQGFDRFDGLELRVDPLGLAARGSLELGADSVRSGGLSLTLASLKSLEPILEFPVDGRAEIDLVDLHAGFDGAIGSRIDARLTDLFLLDAETSDRIGPALSARGSVAMAADGAIRSELAAVSARPGRLSGTVALPATFDRLSANLAARLDASALPPVEGLTVKSRELAGAAEIEGPIAAPRIRFSVDPLDIAFDGNDIDGLAASGALDWRGSIPVVAFRTTGRHAGAALSIAARAVLESERLTLEDIEASALGLDVTGSLRLDGYGLPAAGNLAAASENIGPAAAFAGVDGLAGALRASVRLAPGADGTAQTAGVEAETTGLAMQDRDGVPGAAVGRAVLSGRIADLLRPAGLDLTLNASDVEAGGRRLSRVEARLAGDPDRAALDIALRGDDVLPLTLSARAEISAREAATDVRLAEFSGDYAAIPFSLVEPAELSMQADGTLDLAARLAVSDGEANFVLRRGAAEAGLRFQAVRAPVAPFAGLAGHDGVDGRLDATLMVEEAGGRVTGNAEATLSEISVAGLEDAEGVTASLVAAIGGGAVDLDASAGGPGLRRADLQARIPIALSLIEPAVAVDAQAPLSGTLTLDADLVEIWPLAPLPEHAVSGGVSVEAQISGTLDAPLIAGRAALADGGYEHLELGTLFPRVVAALAFRDQDVVLERFVAEDPAGGTVTAEGAARVDPTSPSLSVRLRASNAQLVRSDSARIWSDVDLSATGTGERADVTGVIEVRRGEVNLGVALPPSVPTLDVAEEQAEAAELVRADDGYAIGLDIEIVMPGQVFVRGRGLDSEWGGNLRVTGTAANPRIVGVLTARRGRFDVIGQSFALEDSTIRFLGGETIDPLLGIRGVSRSDDLTVIARLTGHASAPEIVLESEPPLPRDEILSRVLFGKGKGQLTAMQAAQLAASAAELSGSGTGFDLLGSVRQFVGVDVLQVEAEENGAAVRAGKYVADGVFVGATQGASPGSGSVDVEVELTPNISINSKTGQNDSNVGVQFRWDY